MAEILEKPASVDEVLREVSRIKSVVTDAVDDGIRSALKATKQGREFAAGVVLGSLITWICSSRD